MDNDELNEMKIIAAKKAEYTMPLRDTGSNILFLTNPENELRRLELTLRNAIQTKDGSVRALDEPLLNDDGVISVLGQTQAIVNQVTIMSNLEDKDIIVLLDLFSDTLAKDLMLNRAEYEIENASARSRIYTTAIETAFICMKRALLGGERGFWKGSQQDITTRVEGNKTKGNMMTKFLGWGK